MSRISFYTITMRGGAPASRPVSVFFFSLLLAAVFFAAGAGAPGAQSKRDAADYYREGSAFMLAGDYFRAAQALLEGLAIHPAHAESNAAIAECYYALGEYEEALAWVRKARSFARANLDVANLEAFILAAMGRLTEAETAIKTVLAAEPYNREALFVQGEIDLARGRQGDALRRYREAERRFPDDRRLLLSLALVSMSLGDFRNAQNYIERAMLSHPDDYRVYYYAAYLDTRTGNIRRAIENAEQSLYYKEDFAPSLSLLAGLRYKNGDFDEAVELANRRIAANRADSYAHYLKGLSLKRLAEAGAVPVTQARAALETAVSVDGDDEFTRALFEDVLLQTTNLEDTRRSRFAAWHFRRAEDFKRKNLSDEAIFEYRRGLRINPYAPERRQYAELLKLKGFNESYFAELTLIKELSGEKMADADKISLDDAIEVWTLQNSGSLSARYGIGPEELRRHWRVSFFTIDSPTLPPSAWHPDAAAVAASYLKDILAHDRNVDGGKPVSESLLRQPTFAAAFRTAREQDDDYFMIISIDENERDLSLKGVLYTARTGTEAKTLTAFRSGENRLRNAARALLKGLNDALPFRGEIIRRDGAVAVIDKGRADGVTADTVYEIVRQGRAEAARGELALMYTGDDIGGTFTPVRIDEEVTQGTLSRKGFFDRIAPGDEVILPPKPETGVQNGAQAAAQNGVQADMMSPELRSLLRMAR